MPSEWSGKLNSILPLDDPIRITNRQKVHNRVWYNDSVRWTCLYRRSVWVRRIHGVKSTTTRWSTTWLHSITSKTSLSRRPLPPLLLLTLREVTTHRLIKRRCSSATCIGGRWSGLVNSNSLSVCTCYTEKVWLLFDGVLRTFSISLCNDDSVLSCIMHNVLVDWIFFFF